MNARSVAADASGILRPPRTHDADRDGQVAAFLAQPPERRFVFGTGTISRVLARATLASGLLDDHRVGEVVDGRPVLDPDEAQGFIVANGVAGVFPRRALDRIRRAGATPVDLLAFLGPAFPDLAFPVIGDGFAEEFTANRAVYESIYSRLADDESRETLAAIVSTRIHRDIGFMTSFDDRQHEQYFESFLPLSPDGEVFADVGSFDGATARMFAQRYPGYRHIHALEPSLELAAGVRANLSGLPDVSVHEVGAGDRDGTVGFSSSGSASRVVEGGTERVDVRRLDGLLDPEPTFIKMDIEGQEVPALIGASELIARTRPTLAICCYHRVDDLRTIVQTVDGIHDGYDLYLRHYTEGLTESVYFFIPR